MLIVYDTNVHDCSYVFRISLLCLFKRFHSVLSIVLVLVDEAHIDVSVGIIGIHINCLLARLESFIEPCSITLFDGKSKVTQTNVAVIMVAVVWL